MLIASNSYHLIKYPRKRRPKVVAQQEGVDSNIMMMMAFGNDGKRRGQETMNLDLKKRKVEFALPDESGDDKEFTTEMYKRFLKSALGDLEKV